MFRTRKARRLHAGRAGAVVLSLGLFAASANAAWTNENLWQVQCLGWRHQAVRSEHSDSSSDFAKVDIAAKAMERFRTLYPSYSPFEVVQLFDGTSAFAMTFSSAAGPSNCIITLVTGAQSVSADALAVTAALATTKAAVDAVKGSVDTVATQATAIATTTTSIKTDTAALKGGAEPEGVDFAMVGAYFSTALSAVVGLGLFAWVCGQIIGMVARAR